MAEEEGWGRRFLRKLDIEITDDEKKGGSAQSPRGAGANSPLSVSPGVAHVVVPTASPAATGQGVRCDGYYEAFIQALRKSGGEEFFLFLNTMEGLRTYIADPSMRIQAAVDTLGKTHSVSADKIAAESARLLKVLQQTLEHQLATNATKGQEEVSRKKQEFNAVTHELSQLEARIGALQTRKSQLEAEMLQQREDVEEVKTCLTGAAEQVNSMLTEVQGKITQISGRSRT